MFFSQTLNVLFCLLMSSDYKLPDENHVLLRVLRENNMYNVDLKNVVPSRDLTCLFAKATLDESNLYNRRLGYINFKTMNKLVKGKQHRASCKSKPVSSVSHPLQRSPSIGFMRPFGCRVTILNTLEPLGKFDGKDDEGFLVGYSINRKEYRVFNSRTKIVQKTLHINFLENKPNVAGIRPKWLFDIDTLTQSTNYQPVVAGNQPNHNACIKQNLDTCKVRKETVSAQQYVLLLVWSSGSQDPQNTDDDATFDVKETKNDVHVFSSRSDKPKKHDNKDKRDDRGKSPVDSPIRVRDLRVEFEEFSINSTNRVNAVSAPVIDVGPNLTNNTNSFNTASPSDTALLELMLSKRSKKNTKCVNAVNEELTAAKHKLMLLVYCC
nr:retrovirus-related Pol polyprotein from transposon TNT 1-94 [Tanacetum cinerariifolium]